MRVRITNIDDRPVYLPINVPEGFIQLTGEAKVGYLLKDKLYFELRGHANYAVIVEIPIDELNKLIKEREEGLIKYTNKEKT